MICNVSTWSGDTLGGCIKLANAIELIHFNVHVVCHRESSDLHFPSVSTTMCHTIEMGVETVLVILLTGKIRVELGCSGGSSWVSAKAASNLDMQEGCEVC